MSRTVITRLRMGNKSKPAGVGILSNGTKISAFFAAVSLCMVMGAVPSHAADTTPMADDPGPVASFAWKGFNWQKRFWGGAPQYNQSFDAANVSSPDANGYVTMNLSNPTGSAPAGAEFQSSRQGFGYGTYSTTVEKLSLIHI